MFLCSLISICLKNSRPSNSMENSHSCLYWWLFAIPSRDPGKLQQPCNHSDHYEHVPRCVEVKKFVNLLVHVSKYRRLTLCHNSMIATHSPVSGAPRRGFAVPLVNSVSCSNFIRKRLPRPHRNSRVTWPNTLHMGKRWNCRIKMKLKLQSWSCKLEVEL